MRKWVVTVALAVMAVSLSACETMQSRKDLDIERSNLVTTTATVEAVDMAERSVRMKTAQGDSIVVYATNEVNNLDQVKVGDLVGVEYFESLAVRMAKPGETRDESMDVIMGSQPGDTPAGAAAHQSTITANILAIDKAEQTVTLKGPDGTTVTVDVAVPENLEKVKVGDTIVMTYTEAVAMSIQKITK
jgi:hypothetical protein